MPVINISVKDKIARLETPVNIVCNNSDYVIRFAFDAEWQGYETKTARFVISGKYIDTIFSGAEVTVPIISDARVVAIGVYAGDLHTTTPALIMCDGSITSEGGSPATPSEDVYNAIMQALNDRISEPAQDGTAGQVLATDGSGGRYWTDQTGGGGGAEVEIDNQTIVKDASGKLKTSLGAGEFHGDDIVFAGQGYNAWFSKLSDKGLAFSDTLYYSSILNDGYTPNFYAGDTCTVTINYKSTEHVAKAAGESTEPRAQYLGNLGLVSDEFPNTGENFLYTAAFDGTWMFIVDADTLLDNSDLLQWQIQGKAKKIEQIDPKFIPGITEVPEVIKKYIDDKGTYTATANMKVSDTHPAFAIGSYTAIREAVDAGQDVRIRLQTWNNSYTKVQLTEYYRLVSYGDSSLAFISQNAYKNLPNINRMHMYRLMVSASGIEYESFIISNNITNEVTILSSTPDSTKRFKITVDDSGTISATEVTQ